MGCVLTISFWLLVSCMWSNGAAEDDMADIKKGISQIIQKLSVIENRLTKLEELPREVNNVKVLMTSMIQKSKAHHGSGTSEKHVNGHKQVISGGHPAKPAGVNVKVNSEQDQKLSQKKIQMVDSSSSVRVDGKAKSPLILASAKKVFLSNFHTKTWKEIPMTPNPDSLLYDDVHRRLYWVIKKPGAVGFFTGKDWKSQDVYQTNGSSLQVFGLDEQAEVEAFLFNEKHKIHMMLRKKGKTIKQLHMPSFPMMPPYAIAVNASTQTVIMATSLHHRVFILTLPYSQQGHRTRFVPTVMLPGKMNSVTFDKHSYSFIYGTGKALIRIKVDDMKRIGRRSSLIFRRRMHHPKPDVICPEEIQLLTTSKDHLYVLGKKNVHVYNRKFQLVETRLLPDWKGDRMKTAAAVNMEG